MSAKLDTTGQDDKTIHAWYEKKKKIIELLQEWRADIIYSEGNMDGEEQILEEILTIMNENKYD